MTPNTQRTISLPPKPIIVESPGRFLCFVRDTLTVAEFEELRTLWGSSHMRHKMLNTPARITNEQALVLAGMLSKTPWQLHSCFGVAYSNISYTEACMWWLMDQLASEQSKIDYANLLEKIARNAIEHISTGNDNPLQHNSKASRLKEIHQ